MRFTVAKTITLNKTEREILTHFEEMIDDMDLNAEELEELLFEISRGRTRSDNILINYVDD